MGILYIVATPIGNMDDITYRAVKTLSSVDLVLCEDTRHTGLLMQKLNIATPLQAYYEEIEDKKIPEIVDALTQGRNIALVSDAGTPLVSDPGYRLVRECIKRDIPVVSIPGPSALLAALTSSGLPPHAFHFYGYPPEKQTARLKLFQTLSGTCIFYCAPHKLTATLRDMRDVLGDIDIVIARELTKVYEEIWRGTLTQASEHFAVPQGEFVLLINIPQA